MPPALASAPAMAGPSRTPATVVTLSAMFVAMTLVFQVAPSPPGSLLKFVGFPVILAGLVLGARRGFVVGAVSDVLGFLLHPSGPFFPGFTLTQALTGAVPAWIVGRRPPSFRLYLVAILAGQLLTKAVMVPLFLQALYGIPYWVKASQALYVQGLHAPLYAWAACLVVRALCGRARLSNNPLISPARPPA